MHHHRIARLFALGLIALASTAQAALLDVINWNMGNLPNTATQQSDLRTIVDHMRNASGDRRFAIIAMAETDTDSATATAAVINSAYGTAAYTSIVSSPDGGNDRTGFVYDTSRLALLSSTEAFSAGLTHRVLRAQFRPIDAPVTADADLYVYSVHLKSGTGSSDRVARFTEAQAIRADADSLGPANVLFVGDFNWLGAAERTPAPSAFDALAQAGGQGQAFDPAGAVADTWRDNAAYLALHTNDPGGAMDDRFDMQLASGELLDGAGMDYVAGSYRVVGNNGTHALNADIRTGTGAPAAVLDALYRLSDHLPVAATYRYDVPEPAACAAVFVAVALLPRRRAQSL